MKYNYDPMYTIDTFRKLVNVPSIVGYYVQMNPVIEEMAKDAYEYDGYTDLGQLEPEEVYFLIVEYYDYDEADKYLADIEYYENTEAVA